MSSSKQRRGKAGIVFLIQALAFFLFSERTKVSSASKRSKEPPAKTSLVPATWRDKASSLPGLCRWY